MTMTQRLCPIRRCAIWRGWTGARVWHSLPITPAFPGRLTIALRAADAGNTRAVRDVFGGAIGTVVGEFRSRSAFLSAPRSLVLLDLKILNDLNLPHLQMIAEAFLQPARRNGELLLLRILTDAGLYTFSEAIFGFAFGAALGLVLGAIFAHSPLLERGLLPYVVASQTVPILAIAPMVVIWLGAGQLSVAVIAAYLTFFPVTINTLRGLQSPAAEQVELMRSYAAGRWTISMEAAYAGGAAIYLHGAEGLGDSERGRRDHRRIALGHRRRAGAGDPGFQLRLQPGVDAEALGVHRHGGDGRHTCSLSR